MMPPNAHAVLVEREKITEYLLNPEHRYGASKAQFFAEFGFELRAWEVLADALREHGQHYEVSTIRETLWGPRYEVDGELKTPDRPDPAFAQSGNWTTERLRHGSSRLIL